MAPNKLYIKSRQYLASHKRLALFLSHGGLHIALLVLLLVGVVLMANDLRVSSKNVPVILDFELGDSTVKSKLTNFWLMVDVGKNDNTCTAYSAHAVFGDKWFETAAPPFMPYIKVRMNSGAYHKSFHIKDKDGADLQLKGDFGIRKFEVNQEFADSMVIDSSDLSRTLFSWNSDLSNNRISAAGSVKNESWKNNPYYSLYIRFHYNPKEIDGHILPMSTDSLNLNKAEPFETQIKIRFEMDKFEMNQPRMVAYKSIQPSPSKVGLDYIVYDDPTQIRDILNNGIYIEAEDVALARKAERHAFLFSVLLGTLIAFMLDVIVNLILKWRRLRLQK